MQQTRRRHLPSLSMPPELVDALDRAAKDKGWNRSMLLREITRTWLSVNGYKINSKVASEDAT